MKKLAACISFLGAACAFGVATASNPEIVTDHKEIIRHQFTAQKPLRVFRDPSLFVGKLSLIHADPVQGWDSLFEENPLMTTLTGSVCIDQLKKTPIRFKDFKIISRLYGLYDKRFQVNNEDQSPLIVPVQICNEDSYSEFPGFVLLADLEEARKREGLPPSTRANPIPQLPPR